MTKRTEQDQIVYMKRQQMYDISYSQARCYSALFADEELFLTPQ